MKRLIILPILIAILIASCSKMAQEPGGGIPDLSGNLSEMPVTPNGMPFQRTCATNEVFQQQLRDNPGLGKRIQEIEEFTSRKTSEFETMAILPDGTIVIPVHINILYNNENNNISDAQIQSQIDVLNADFGASNTDYNSTTYFNNVKAGDTKIKFTWTSGVENTTRKQTSTTSWGTNNYMKSSQLGGIDPTTPTAKLNIWVCNLANNILGYAQFPGGNSSTDGVVIDNNAFGKGNFSLFQNFNLGRTATHEVGHWLNLRHIWGDRTCGSDNVNDTPTHNTYNYGCPSLPHYSTCKGRPLEMTMNYMDYTDDRCMYMFSAGQKSRMLAVFASGGPRNSFAQP